MHADSDSEAQVPKGVSLLRVSTLAQVNTDYDPEGISLPAQRKACQRKAAEMGVSLSLDDEYIEPGVSGRDAKKRRVFQQMIERIKRDRDIKYVFVYSLSRFARNRYDDAIMSSLLEELGITLVSATENIHAKTPSTRAMHGMLAVFNELRSQMDGEDIKFKMGEKARHGGTLGWAKIGYLNIREKFEGREVRTIALDEQRAPFIKQIFELYATGRYTYGNIREILTERGLRTRPTKKHPAGTPISIHTIGNILTDHYYCGYVTYQGAEYPGRHPAIITEELYNQVQHVLATNIHSGTRRRVHHHHLKGRLWCARCQRRLIIAKGNGNGGTYFYYLCTGRQTQHCNQPYMPIHGPNGVEHAVSNHYNTVSLGDALHAKAKTELDITLQTELANTDDLRTELTKQLQTLDTQENAFLELVGHPEWPQSKLTTKMRNIRQQRQGIRAQLADLDTRLDAGKEVFLLGLNLLRQPRHLYDQGTDEIKKLLTTVIFSKIYLDAQPDGTINVTNHELEEPFNTITTAAHHRYDHIQTIPPRKTHTEPPNNHLALWQPQPPTTNWSNTPTQSITPATTPHDLPNPLFHAKGSSKNRLVELRGVEPLTFSMRTPGAGVSWGRFRSSWAAGECFGVVLVSVVAVLRCCTAMDRAHAGTIRARAARTRCGIWCRTG